jgi:hypothetical protein
MTHRLGSVLSLNFQARVRHYYFYADAISHFHFTAWAISSWLVGLNFNPCARVCEKTIKQHRNGQNNGQNAVKTLFSEKREKTVHNIGKMLWKTWKMLYTNVILIWTEKTWIELLFWKRFETMWDSLFDAFKTLYVHC